ncbi:MAG: tetratricopeptide repeat protein [Rhodospirillales bacterium]
MTADPLTSLRQEASALNTAGHHEDALARYDDLVARAPDEAAWHNERAAVLRNLGRIAEARTACERAVALAPDLALAHVNLAGLLLTQGHYREGFRAYEWRLRVPDCHVPALGLRAPMWDGQPARDKCLLVAAEQGLGDTVQFVRFLAKARTRVGRLVLVVQTPLKGLCGGVAGADAVLASGETLPRHDLKISLLSLPHRLRTSLATLPAPERYLHGPPIESVQGGGLRVGIAWQGNPEGAGDRGRSVTLDILRPVLSASGVRFFSLQKNFGLDQLAAFPEVEDVGSRCATFADTAAIMKTLDLVITTDTAVAHVAGALGRPTWLLLKRAPAWRWLENRTDSPWYPSMRLYRQAMTGDWGTPVQRIAADLARVSAARDGPVA